MSWLKDIVTTADGQTHDLGRWSWVGSFLAVLGSVAHNAWHGAIVDVMQVSQALGIVAAAHGAALWAKKDTEPK